MNQQSKNNIGKAWNALGLGDTWQGLDLDHPELVTVVNGVRNWFNTNVKKWSHGGQLGGNACVIAGHYGTGKSHIAHTIRRLVGRYNCVFWDEPDLLAALWETYKQGHKSSERRLYREARQAPLMILDDLGAGHVNSEGWLHQLYYNLFEYDPLQGRGGILITTNMAWQSSSNAMPFARRVGNRALSRIIHQLGGPNPDTDRPHNWLEMWNVRDRRFDYSQAFTDEKDVT